MNKIYLAFGTALLLIAISIIPSTAINLSLDKTPPILLDGNTIYVGGNGPGNYTNIQDAINDSSVGDNIFVYTGEYHENVNINKSIQLIGEKRETTIINADFQGDVIYVSADNITVTGFSLVDSQDLNYYGAGIRISSGDNITISNNRIIDNYYGLIMDNSSINNIFDNIIHSNLGRGIRLEMSSNNIIFDNSVIDEGGISLYDSFDNEIKDNEFINSFVGVYLERSSNNSIINNFITETVWEGYLAYKQPCTNNITGNTITNNMGYGIHLQSSHNIVTNNIIENNDRAGIAMTGSSNVISENLIINNDEAGGIHFSGSYNIIQKNTIMRNYEYGIRLSNGSYNLITENTFEDNYMGLRIYYSSNNSVIRNNFINQKKNAVCPFSSTIWDDGNLGNYWSDYIGEDNDGDGIGDTPKSIEDDSNKDRYPLMVPYGPNTSICISSPREGFIYLRNFRLTDSSLNIVFGNIKIKASAVNYMDTSVKVEKVEFYIDGRLRWVDKTAPFSWRWRLSSHLKHNHTFSVVVYDSSGNTAMDEQQVWRFL